MKAERKGINSMFIAVVLSYGLYTRKDLRTQKINLAGVVSGLLGQAKESLSIGCVKEFPISSSKLQKLFPEGIAEYTKELDELGYITLRQYTGKEDFYVTNANVLAADGSDFPYVENVRVLNRIVREVSKRQQIISSRRSIRIMSRRVSNRLRQILELQLIIASKIRSSVPDQSRSKRKM